jgi:hypothetical protein
MSRLVLDFLEHTRSDEESFSLLYNSDFCPRRFVVRPVARDARVADAFLRWNLKSSSFVILQRTSPRRRNRYRHGKLFRIHRSIPAT